VREEEDVREEKAKIKLNFEKRTKKRLFELAKE